MSTSRLIMLQDIVKKVKDTLDNGASKAKVTQALQMLDDVLSQWESVILSWYT